MEESERRTLSDRPISRWPCLLLSALFLYVASYLLLVEAHTGFMSGVGPWKKHPRYLVGGTVAEIVYFPLNALDMHIRPTYWERPDMN
jgi:hypothetical protein